MIFYIFTLWNLEVSLFKNKNITFTFNTREGLRKSVDKVN
jgi:hypothetical protein